MAKTQDNAETAVWECRLHFLQAAAKHPQIRSGDSLRKRVFEPSRVRWTELGLPVPNVPEWTPAQHEAGQSFDDEVSRRIGEWAASHNLNYDWVHSAARGVLGWEVFPVHPFGTIPGYRPPDFRWPAWYFDHESEQTYRDRIKASFRKAREEHIKAIKQKRSQFLKDRGSHSVHYRWTVEHVCLSWTWARIARENVTPVTWQAVRKAVVPILERIGIPK